MTRRVFCKVLLVVVAIFGLLVLSGVLSAQGRSEDAFERVKNVQEKHTDILMARPGVVGTAVGLNDDGEYAVLVLLEIPGVAGIPETLEGVPIQVVVTGKILALTTGRFPRPVPIGVSTGHPDITAGTIACRVKDSADNVYALSNNHVYANQNDASIGDNVLQPGSYDGGIDSDDAIGTLADFEPIVFSRRARNEIDAAIALSSTAELDNATPGGYGTPSSTIVPAVLGQQVQKFGRTTELTNGEVTGVNATVNVGYGPGKTAKFVKQIIIEPGGFSAGGDSGSLIVTNDEFCNPVGLLFAGSSSHTVANRIDLVLSRFGVTVDDSPEGPVGDSLPTVAITDPSNGDTVSGTTTVTAVASDDNGVTKVEFFVNGGSIGTDTEGDDGWSATWVTTGFAEGTHAVSATATDTSSQTGSHSISVIVDNEPSAGATTVSVASIEYATEGGKKQDKHLLITIALVDKVSGASVSIDLFRGGKFVASGTATTGTDGKVTFSLKNAPSGTYTTEVTDVTAAELTWDGLTPDNSFPK